jgi:hypothetical protein
MISDNLDLRIISEEATDDFLHLIVMTIKASCFSFLL